MKVHFHEQIMTQSFHSIEQNQQLLPAKTINLFFRDYYAPIYDGDNERVQGEAIRLSTLLHSILLFVCLVN